MTDESQNATLLNEDKKAITDGANWLSQWITERYNQGVLSKDEYDGAIGRLKNVKVFVVEDTNDGLVKALEKGDLHLKNEAIERFAKAYEWEHFELLFEEDGLTDKQHAIAYLKEALPSSKGPLGMYASFIDEPAIFLNVNTINERSKNDYFYSLTSATVHELTHNLELKGQEVLIENALQGESVGRDFQKPDEKIIAPVIDPEISVLITDQYTGSHSKPKTYDNPGISLKEGVDFNPYLDNKAEVYARLMQLRYDFGLKPDETFTKEQVDEIERRAKAARENFEPGKYADIDVHIVKRYRNNTIQDMLNFTAEEKTDVKGAFKVQEWQSKRLVAQQKVDTTEKAIEDDRENKSIKTPVLVQKSGRDLA